MLPFFKPSFAFGSLVCFDLHRNGIGAFIFFLVLLLWFIRIFFVLFYLVILSKLCLIHVNYTHTIRMNFVYKWWNVQTWNTFILTFVWLFSFLFFSFFSSSFFSLPFQNFHFFKRQMKFIRILCWMFQILFLWIYFL